MKTAAIDHKTWDEFCYNSPDAWLRHTSSYIELGLTLGGESLNHSFAVLEEEEEKVIAIVPLVSQNGPTGREFAMGGTPTPFPALLHDINRESVLRFIFAEIERIAKSSGIQSARFFIDPLSKQASLYTKNILVEYDFTDTAIETTVIDLTAPEHALLAEMAKGHRSDIQFGGKKGYAIDFFDRNNFLPLHEVAFKDIYFTAAGKEVGTPERWDAIFRLVKEGRSLVVFGSEKPNGKWVTCSLVMLYKEKAYYSLSAMLPEARKGCRGLGHVLQWRTMLYLKSLNFTCYELGWQEGQTLKEASIAKFKRLFGGKLVPLYRGERKYL